jgi:hypothetical protein
VGESFELMNIQQSRLINSQIELFDQIPKVVVLEDRGQVHDFCNGISVFEFVSFECSDDICGQCHESFFFVWFVLGGP